jgi:tetratricopeptide (TPR) repeat protein
MEKALDYYEQALALCRSRNDVRTTGQIYEFIAAEWWDAGNFNKTLINLEQALMIWRTLSHKSNEANTLNTMTAVSTDFNHKQQAQTYKQ